MSTVIVCLCIGSVFWITPYDVNVVCERLEVND